MPQAVNGDVITLTMVIVINQMWTNTCMPSSPSSHLILWTPIMYMIHYLSHLIQHPTHSVTTQCLIFHMKIKACLLAGAHAKHVVKTHPPPHTQTQRCTHMHTNTNGRTPTKWMKNIQQCASVIYLSQKRTCRSGDGDVEGMRGQLEGWGLYGQGGGEVGEMTGLVLAHRITLTFLDCCLWAEWEELGRSYFLNGCLSSSSSGSDRRSFMFSSR